MIFIAERFDSYKKSSKKIDRDSIYSNLSVVVIVLVGIYCFLSVTLRPANLHGEGSNYLLSLVALENHASLFIKESDYQKVATDFPDVYPGIQWRIDNGFHTCSEVTLRNGNVVKHGWYAGTYMLCVIPVHMLIKIIGLPQSYCFMLTNVILYILALYVVYCKLNISDKYKFITIILLAFSLGLFHIAWPSSEVFIWSMIVMSLVFWKNKNYKSSILLSSLAATMNQTIVGLLAVIVIDYLIDFCNKKPTKVNWFVYRKRYFKDLLLTALCCVPVVFVTVYNIVLFGALNLTAINDGIHLNDYWWRFCSYLFDFNYGFFPYFIIVFSMFLIFIIVGIAKRDKDAILYFIGFFSVVAMYSVQYHINCGTTAIARYNSWSFPIFIFYLTTVSVKYFGVLKKIFDKMLYLSVVYTMFIVFLYGGVNADGKICWTEFTPIAKSVINVFPDLYNPYHFTFVSRVLHVDGGYFYESPVIYCNSEGMVRKILVTPSTVDQVLKMIAGDDDSMNYIITRVDALKTKAEGFYFINVSLKYNLREVKSQ